MKKLLVSATLVALFCTTAQAAPDRMSFTGRLADETGLLEGPVQVSFAIFDAATGGTMLWEEAHSNITAEDGLIFVELGGTTDNGLDAEVFAGDAAYLEVTVNGETMTPRSAILSVPYATSASRANVARAAELLGTLSPEDVARADHTHAAADIVGTIGDAQIDCYADLVADGHVDGNASTDLVTVGVGNALYLNAGEAHNHDASQIASGTLAFARYDAYGDLNDAGRLDGNASADLLTRSVGDTRFLNVGESHTHSAADINSGTLSTARYDAYNDLSVAGRLDNNASTDLVTRSNGDGRYLRSGDNVVRFYGCGTYVLANFCPAGNTGVGPNCDDVPAGSFCEADGECGLSTAGNCGVGAWYFKQTE